MKQSDKNINSKKGFFQQVYELTKKIPIGKVMTYGQIARILGTKDARRVGWALHANDDSKVPCHRVVSKDGHVASNYAFDGWKEQKRRLISEGIDFVDEMHVNLKRHLADAIAQEPKRVRK